MCCCDKDSSYKAALIVSAAIDRLTAELVRFRKDAFPPPSKPVSAGHFKHVEEIRVATFHDQEEVSVMFIEKFAVTLDPLPPKSGNNADILKGHYTFTQEDGTVSIDEDVAYDLTSRECLTVFAVQGPKGTTGTGSLVLIDDDGNSSAPATVSHTFIDATAPDAPVSAGSFSHTGEEEVADV